MTPTNCNIKTEIKNETVCFVSDCVCRTYMEEEGGWAGWWLGGRGRGVTPDCDDVHIRGAFSSVQTPEGHPLWCCQPATPHTPPPPPPIRPHRSTKHSFILSSSSLQPFLFMPDIHFFISYDLTEFLSYCFLLP